MVDRKKLLEMLQVEAEEQINTIRRGLDQLVSGEVSESQLDEIYRAAHTLKGNSGSAGIKEVEELTHALEDFFGEIKEAGSTPGPDAVDLGHEVLDEVEYAIDSVVAGEEVEIDTAALLNRLESVEVDADSPADESQPDQLDAAVIEDLSEKGDLLGLEVEFSDECRMPGVRATLLMERLQDSGPVVEASIPERDKLESGVEFEKVKFILSGAGSLPETFGETLEEDGEIKTFEVRELEASEESLRQEFGVREVDESAAGRAAGEADIRPVNTVRVDSEHLDSLLDSLGELTVQRLRLENRVPPSPEVDREFLKLRRLLDELQADIMQTRLMPVSHVFDRFPRLVRDLARELDKEVKLEVTGEETELDKKLVDLLGDPLVHIIRNAVDHGIEPPEVRREKGKPTRGTVRLEATHAEGEVVIRASDDGRGLEPRKIAESAVEKGIVDEAEVDDMDEDSMVELIMEPGFSTNDEVTDLSGRGVGMDVVRNTVEKFRGSMSIDSEPDRGTEIEIRFPLTLAVIDCLLVKVRASRYAVPLELVNRTALVDSQNIFKIENELYCRHEGERITCHWLENVYGGELAEFDDGFYPVIFCEHRESKTGLICEEIIDQEDVVVKPLNKYISTLPGYAGTTFLGDGQATFILDPLALLEESQR